MWQGWYWLWDCWSWGSASSGGVGRCANPPRQSGIGKEQARMQYLVTEELINPGPQLPPDQLVGIMRQWVLPSMDTLINLKSEGKIIAGGLRVGERALVLIFEAQSNEELDTILQSLPLWGLAEWKVTPLETLEGRTGRDRQFIEQLEQSLQG